MMTLKVRYVGQVAIVDIRGKITVGKGAVVLRRELLELLNSDRGNILLNLENTTYVDSCGLSELVATAAELTGASLSTATPTLKDASRS